MLKWGLQHMGPGGTALPFWSILALLLRRQQSIPCFTPVYPLICWALPGVGRQGCETGCVYVGKGHGGDGREAGGRSVACGCSHGTTMALPALREHNYYIAAGGGGGMPILPVAAM